MGDAGIVPDIRGGGLSITLAWDAPVDLDLYFTDPTTETAYFGNASTRSGVHLQRDEGCDEVQQQSTPFFETAATERLLSGRYRVGVDFLDRCHDSSVDSVPYRVRVRLGDAVVEAEGVARFDMFTASVIEFEVTGDPPSLTRVEPTTRPSMILPAPRRG